MNVNHIFFYFGFVLILIHEMDAVRQKEWVIFPGLSFLDEKKGYLVFTILHIPLYLYLFYALKYNEAGIIHGLDIFFVIHVGLHLLFLLHKKNPFKSFFSWSVIIGAGFFGLLDILFPF